MSPVERSEARSAVQQALRNATPEDLRWMLARIQSEQAKIEAGE